MGSGLGRVCKRVLHKVDKHPDKWVRLTSAAESPSEASSLRRAAHTLERRGLIELNKHHDKRGTWLIARRPRTPEVPADLAKVLGPSRCQVLLDGYKKSRSLEAWHKAIDNATEYLKNELWQCLLDTGLTIDEAETSLIAVCQAKTPGGSMVGSSISADTTAAASGAHVGDRSCRPC